jgi:hypothetical protein
VYQIQVKPADANGWSPRSLDAGINASDREAVIGQARRMLATTSVFSGIGRMADGSAGKPAEVRVVDAKQRVIWPYPA